MRIWPTSPSATSSPSPSSETTFDSVSGIGTPIESAPLAASTGASSPEGTMCEGAAVSVRP